MGALVGGDDEVAGLVLDGFEGSDVSVEFACVLADEIVTFADLGGGLDKDGWMEGLGGNGYGMVDIAWGVYALELEDRV